MSDDTLAVKERDQQALQEASQRLLDIRHQMADIAERQIKIAIAEGDGEKAAECSRRVDVLAAEERAQTACVEALAVREDKSRRAHADDELPGLLAAGTEQVGDLMEAVAALAQATDRYLAARRVCQQCLRDSSRRGSVVGTYPRPASGSIPERVLRLFEELHGQPHG